MSVPDEQLEAGRLVAESLEKGREMIRPGAELLDVAETVESSIRDQGADLAFPLNVSIDDQAAHYTPHSQEETTFEPGQVVKLDCGVHVDGYIGDAATTVEVGSARHARLTEAAATGLERALNVIQDGVQLKEIGQTIEAAIASYGMRPISNLTGHTIERWNLHAGTSIPNVPSGQGGRLRAGTVCAIEPFATDGQGKIEHVGQGHIYHFVRRRPVKDDSAGQVLDLIADDHPELPFAERWLTRKLDRPVQDDLDQLRKVGAVKAYPILVEVDRGLVAQAEHTIHVTETGCEILTQT